jgi:hypothetical protein
MSNISSSSLQYISRELIHEDNFHNSIELAILDLELTENPLSLQLVTEDYANTILDRKPHHPMRLDINPNPISSQISYALYKNIKNYQTPVGFGNQNNRFTLPTILCLQSCE